MKGDAMTTAVYKRNLIEAGVFLAAGLLLLLFVLEPVQCHAQAEINPDHYDTPNSEPLSPAGSSAAAGRSTGDFRGTFTVPFDIRCAGLILLSGSYSISVRSVAKSDEITLVPPGTTPSGSTHE
jgi:hypothetical protein